MTDPTEGPAPGEVLGVSPEEIDLDILEHTISFYVRVLAIAVTRDWESRLDDLDLLRGTGKVTALMLIGRHPGIRPSVIAQVTMKDRSEIARVLDSFEKNGLITRRTNMLDSRAWALFLTDAGHRLVDDLRQRIKSSRAFFSDVSDEEYTQAIAVLRKVYWGVIMSPNTVPRPAAAARRLGALLDDVLAEDDVIGEPAPDRPSRDREAD